MNYFFPILFSAGLILQGCGAENGNPTVSDSTNQPTTTTTKLPDSVPRKVMFGKEGTYSYTPDSCFNELTLGSPQSFKNYRLANGAKMVKLEGERKKMAWFNVESTEEMEVCVTGNESRGYYPYKMIVQKAGQKGAPVISEKHEYGNKGNFVSGHGIYIGMSPDYVLHVYQSQAMMQWQKGDTLYLQYKPKEKDAEYFKRYSWKSYTVTYKFVDDRLRRMEYEVDPTEFEMKD